MPLPLVLIHGYSDFGESFVEWKNLLIATGKYTEKDIHICSYRTLTNEVTIKDIAEGLDRALRLDNRIALDQPFDAIVHSTGMLVLRCWLTMYSRKERLKHLIAIAPASFGSPLAHKGRSWIGSIFKGSKEWGPDFMNAGDLVLDGLELGSRFTWDLAHKDLVGAEVFYGTTDKTPFVFTFCGNEHYSGLKNVVTKSPGTDGTVRWAGCTLNARKITLDFTLSPFDKTKPRHKISKWPVTERTNLAMPFIPIAGLNHSSILLHPTAQLIQMAARALEVNNMDEYSDWIKSAANEVKETIDAMPPWQQFIIKARDERGDPINDYNLQLYKLSNSKNAEDDDWDPIPIDVHSYSTDNSYRCFHINLTSVLKEDLDNLKLEFMASSGTELLDYLDYVDEKKEHLPAKGQPTFTMNLTPLLHDDGIRFFYPFTTTLIEIILNREPMPLMSKNKITWFLQQGTIE